MGEFRMPSLGADMDVGTIVEWLVKPGDVVHRGQIVAVVDTAKAAIEIEAFEEGVLEEILIGLGVQVPVGTPLAVIGESVAAGADRGAGQRVGGGSGEGAAAGADAGGATGADAGGDAGRSSGVSGGDAGGATGGDAGGDAGGATGGDAGGDAGRGSGASGEGARALGKRVVAAHPRATPPIRHLAHQLGVDLDEVTGSGPDGRITHDDLLHATPSPDSRQDRGRLDARDLDQPPEALPKAAADPRGAGRLRVSPRARRLAAERGIDVGARCRFWGARGDLGRRPGARDRTGGRRIRDRECLQLGGPRRGCRG